MLFLADLVPHIECCYPLCSSLIQKNLGMVHFIIIICKYSCISYFKVVFAFVNRVKPDEMQCFAAFHLGLHFLPMSSFRSFQYIKGYTVLQNK